MKRTVAICGVARQWRRDTTQRKLSTAQAVGPFWSGRQATSVNVYFVYTGKPLAAHAGSFFGGKAAFKTLSLDRFQVVDGSLALKLECEARMRAEGQVLSRFSLVFFRDMASAVVVTEQIFHDYHSFYVHPIHHLAILEDVQGVGCRPNVPGRPGKARCSAPHTRNPSPPTPHPQP